MKFLKWVIATQVKVSEFNPFLGGALFVFMFVFLVVWIPVQAYNFLRLPLSGSVTAMFALYAANLFVVFQKIKF